MIDLHPDFSAAHTISKAYFSLPIDYLDPIGGAHWSDSDPGLAIGTRDGIVGYEAIASFLEGFASQRSIVPFGAVVHLLMRFVAAAPANRGFANLNRLLRIRGDRPFRNAGALFGSLCAGLRASVSAGDVQVLCGRLRDTSFPLQWFAGLHNGRAVASEEPELSAESFDDFLVGGLDRLTEDEIAHWLQFGRGSIGAAGKKLLQEPPAPPPWNAIVSELLRRPRLSAASAYADQMVTALSLPPRRHAPQQLPLGGYADVVTRGHVERLLPSQHAFDDLDFLRRYAEGELLYFRREEPPSRNRMEMAIALDQGVRTWGDVRLVLAAAVIALVGRADRKKLRLTIAATSRPGYVEPLGMAAEDLGQLLEASDLSRDPGMALERVLDDPAAAPRDIYLLTHPFALAVDDVRSAALRLRPGDRLFALTLNAKGAAELGEIRRGLPVRLRAFHVDFAAATAPPAAKPPRPQSIEPARWTGSIEDFAWPFPCPIEGPVAHFDFDHAGSRLFVVYANGMIATWDLATKRMEILPRPMHDGRILVKWEHTLGVRDGFTLIGEVGRLIVVVHYDMRSRNCRTIPVDEGSPACRLLPWRANHAIIVVRGLWMAGMVILSKGIWKPADEKERRVFGGRTLREFDATEISKLGTYAVEGGAITLVDPDMMAPQWQPFIPKTDGQPTFDGTRIITLVQLAGSAAAIASRDVAHCDRIDFFRGPNGDFLRQLVFGSGLKRLPRFRLSQDGRLVAFCLCERLEVQPIADPRRECLTPSGTGRHAPRLWIGDGGFVISCGRNGHTWHLVEWWAGVLTVESESRRSQTLRAGFKSPVFERFITRGTHPAVIVPRLQPSDTSGIVCHEQIGSLILSMDRLGQVFAVENRGEVLLQFYARGDSWSAWMPDGTRLGRGNVHLWRNTPGAAVKMGAALRRAMEGDGA